MIGNHFQRLVGEKCTSRGRVGVVGATSPYAAVIGRDAFQRGGNAFDAALSAALAETVLLPSKCGLAGDLVALCSVAGEAPRALLAIGCAPARLGDAVKRIGYLPLTGALSVGVPGAPSGYSAVSELGRLGLAAAIEPARELASNGVPWSLVTDRNVRAAKEGLKRENPSGTTYMPEGSFIRVGTRVAMDGLARVLGEFSARERELFRGPLGRAVVSSVRERGGVLSLDDLSGGSARWSDAVSTVVAGRRLWATPLPTHGASLLESLTDAHTDVDVDADDLWHAVDNAISKRDLTAGDPEGDGGTAVASAADAAGNAIVIVHSNSSPTFGSGIVVPEYDLVLANRAGRGFSATLGHSNFPHWSRRPLTTLHAWCLESDLGSPRIFGATPGGDNQVPWNAQVLMRLLKGVSPQEAVMSPLWRRVDAYNCEVESAHCGRDLLASTVERLTDVPACSLTSGVQLLSIGEGLLSVTSDVRSIGGTAGC